MIESTHVYKAWLKRVIDADTVELFIFQVDYGFSEYKITVKQVRLLGIDCWESRHKDPYHKSKGKIAKDDVVRWLTGKWLEVHTHQNKKSFERWIGEVFIDGDNLKHLLRKAGHEKK